MGVSLIRSGPDYLVQQPKEIRKQQSEWEFSPCNPFKTRDRLYLCSSGFSRKRVHSGVLREQAQGLDCTA